MILAESAESRLSPLTRVATRALTQRPRPRAGSYEEDGEEQGTKRPDRRRSGQDRRAISGPLATPSGPESPHR
jgi:hypothetical protein